MCDLVSLEEQDKNACPQEELKTPAFTQKNGQQVEEKEGVGQASGPSSAPKEAYYLRDDINWRQELQQDPLFAWHYWRYNYGIPGLGLFTEGYVLFSYGNCISLFRQTWPECFVNPPPPGVTSVCNSSWVAAINYLQISGILCGQLVLGFLMDILGRRRIQIFDALNMTIAVILLISVRSSTLQGFAIALAWSYFYYGFGVGGEYPTTSSIAAEKAGSSAQQQKSRGKTVVLTFALQGWGQIVNVSVLLLLLLIFNSGSTPPYSSSTAHATFSVSYALVMPVMLFMCYWRVWRMRENVPKQQDRADVEDIADSKLGHSSKTNPETPTQGQTLLNFMAMLATFWPRLLASMGGWFINDVVFFGSKVFIGDFVALMNPGGASVTTIWLWTLLQTGIQLVGYYSAAYLIDARWYGRRRMQMVGFAALFVCYLVTACLYSYFTDPINPRVTGYQIIFYLQAFFQQFGPNCTTFLVAAEIYPTPVRGKGHGMSAAAGKLGALLCQVAFTYVGKRVRIIISCAANLIGFILTWIFLPDVTGLDLSELDAWWTHIRQGQASWYRGPAVSPNHLSVWERWVLRWHKNYAADGDGTQLAEGPSN